MVTNWATLVSKKANLAQLVTIKNCARTLKNAEALIYSVFDKQCFFNKLGPVDNY